MNTDTAPNGATPLADVPTDACPESIVTVFGQPVRVEGAHWTAELGWHNHPAVASRLATIQPYKCPRDGTAGSRELVNGRAKGGAPRCNNCGRSMVKVLSPYTARVKA